jgi:RAB6A-GEF complex partner protein 2
MSFLTPSFLRGKDEPAYHDGDEDTDTDIPSTTIGEDDGDASKEEDDDGSSRWKGKGREGLLEPDGLGDEDEWRKMKLERVECEIPIEVWPGNTAFRPAEVVFEI